jgi:predicted AAA+ superfamily ATPase
METETLSEIKSYNPWLMDRRSAILSTENYCPRIQTKMLLLPDWHTYWLVLTGPRRAGKTTLGKHLADAFIKSKAFDNLLYLNCDYFHTRTNLHSPALLTELFHIFSLKNPVVMIDEVQRLENPGLLLKIIADLQWPIKMIATGSSQLEIKSKVQEHLTGRQFSALILPLSFQEISGKQSLEECLLFGSYPQVVLGQHKALILQQLYPSCRKTPPFRARI